MQKSLKRSEQISKEQIRKEYRCKRNTLTMTQVSEWSESICRRLVNTELFRQAEAIYYYYPLGNEVNLLPAVQEALRMGKKVGFPKTEGDVMQFFCVDSLENFQEGCFHVMEPVSNRLLEAETPLILTPGLVFDNQKNRMGYGKGYYDRYTANVPGAVKVGIAYEMQLAEAVPVSVFDIPMDYMITEQRIW